MEGSRPRSGQCSTTQPDCSACPTTPPWSLGHVSDFRLRELCRRWLDTGTDGDEALFLTELVRVGALPLWRLVVAASLGHEAARQAACDWATCDWASGGSTTNSLEGLSYIQTGELLILVGEVLASTYSKHELRAQALLSACQTYLEDREQRAFENAIHAFLVARPAPPIGLFNAYSSLCGAAQALVEGDKDCLSQRSHKLLEDAMNQDCRDPRSVRIASHS